MTNTKKFILAFLLIALFLFLRFWNISNSLFFWNDMGRDMVVLQNWQETGKPPLLGPQTSALPFNQSAIYFYILYPGFILSQGHPIAQLVTCAIIYIFYFLAGLILLRKNQLLTKILLVCFFLVAIHPQYIAQNKFVWNPSFVTPFVIAAIFSFYLLLQKFSLKQLIFFTFNLSLAISLSYSVAPLLLVFALYWLVFNRRHLLKYLLGFTGSLFLMNLPTVFFEFRHHFLLTQSLLFKDKLTQDSLSFFDKLHNFSYYVISGPSLNFDYFITVIISVIALIFIFRHHRNSLSFYVSVLFLALTLLTFVTPVTLQAHYIFALTSLIFILISSLPAPIFFPLLLLISFFYLRPQQLTNYFQTAPRTYQQLTSCFSQFCSQFKDPIFVSVQSNYHPFHNGPEHRYLLKKSGCNVREIETQNGQANYMAVILDNGTLTDQTSYYELSLFSPYQKIKDFNCQSNLGITILQKL